MKIKITTIYTPTPISVSPSTSLYDSIAVMRKNRISCLLVSDNDKPIGIYTEMDMVRSLNNGGDYKKQHIGDNMSQPVVTASMEITIFEASYILTTQKIRHLIITNPAGEVAGIVTQTDILKHFGMDYFMKPKSINNVMNKNILTASPEASLRQAIEKMACYSSGCVIAEKNKQPVGILTERDVAALILDDADINNMTLQEVMSSPVITTHADITTYDAVILMNRHKMRRLVVVNKSKHITGLLIQENIIRELEGSYIDFLKNVLGDKDKNLSQTKENFQRQSHYFQSILRSSIDRAIIATDLDFRVIYHNPAAEKIFQRSPYAIKEKCISNIFPTKDFTAFSFDKIKQHIDKKGEYRFSYQQNNSEKKQFIEARITNIVNEDNHALGYTLILRDATEYKSSQEKLRLASLVYENVIEGIMITDKNGNIQSVNPAFTKITGYSEKDVIGKNPRLLQSNRQSKEFYKNMWRTILATGSWQGELWNRRKNGETFPERLTISTVKDNQGNITQYTAVFYDITDIKAHEEQVKYQAYHDPLTTLPNRLLFQDRLAQAIERAKRRKTQLAVMFLDIDHFKKLNDTLGHYNGDIFLHRISIQLKACLRASDTISRFGGDEFTILMEECRAEDNVIVAKKILSLFNTPFEIDGQEIYLGTSIGIARYPNDGQAVDSLIKNADTAMYHVKSQSRNNYHFFKQEMEDKITRRVKLESDLRKALERDQLSIVYQPIISLKDKSIQSMEALLRWNKPGSSNIPPKQFIPIAEESGLIVVMGEWVLKRTCQQLALWDKAGIKHIAVSVNLSARQFNEKQLVQTIKNILTETNAPPQRLHLEITETAMMDDIDNTITTLNKLKALGIRICVDDFGTGYSSFTYLKHFPVDALKLDHTFMRDVVEDPDAARIAAGIISLAKGLKLDIVAEGIETQDQLSFLEKHHCDKAQGFMFHQPLAENEVINYLHQKNSGQTTHTNS